MCRIYDLDSLLTVSHNLNRMHTCIFVNKWMNRDFTARWRSPPVFLYNATLSDDLRDRKLPFNTDGRRALVVHLSTAWRDPGRRSTAVTRVSSTRARSLLSTAALSVDWRWHWKHAIRCGEAINCSRTSDSRDLRRHDNSYAANIWRFRSFLLLLSIGLTTDCQPTRGNNKLRAINSDFHIIMQYDLASFKSSYTFTLQ